MCGAAACTGTCGGNCTAGCTGTNMDTTLGIYINKGGTWCGAKDVYINKNGTWDNT